MQKIDSWGGWLGGWDGGGPRASGSIGLIIGAAAAGAIVVIALVAVVICKSMRGQPPVTNGSITTSTAQAASVSSATADS